MKVAVTGSLGSGKSTVGKMLAATLGTELLDTDVLCRRQLLPGAEGFQQFCHTFGDRFLNDGGGIDRQLLRQAVFGDVAVREKLESILHPIVRRQVTARGMESASRGEILVVEVPLLFEAGWQDEFDVIVVVHVPESLCVQRVMARDEMSADQIKQVLGAQLPAEKKLDYANFIVDNSGIFVSTVQQIFWLSRRLSRERRE